MSTTIDKPKYKMFRCLCKWRVQEVQYSENGGSSTIGPVLGDHTDREAARKQLYELNGWKFKPETL